MIKELSMIHFHVAALTEMSAKLMAIGKYDNVTLYPTITMQKIPSLYEIPPIPAFVVGSVDGILS